MTSHAIQPAAMRTGLKTHYIGTLSKIEIHMEITRAWGVPLSNNNNNNNNINNNNINNITIYKNHVNNTDSNDNN